MLLIPLTTSLILPFDSKQINRIDKCHFARGGYGTICSAEIKGNQIAIKKQKLCQLAVNDLTVILYSTSKSIKNVIPAALVTLITQSISFGMPRLPTDANIVWIDEPQDALKKDIWHKVNEQTVLDVINGIKGLNEIGVLHKDIHNGNVLLDFQGRAFISDFSFANFVQPLTENYYNQRQLNDGMYCDYEGSRSSISNFQLFFKHRNIRVQNDWERIITDFSIPEKKAMTTVRLAELIEEGAYTIASSN